MYTMYTIFSVQRTLVLMVVFHPFPRSDNLSSPPLRYGVARLLVIASVGLLPAAAQTTIPCAGRVDETEHCFRDVAVAATPVAVDSTRNYRLEELIDIAETNHPRTRMAWEQAKQAAERVGIARAAYLPELALLAYFGDERIINPFPKPLAPRGYTMVEMPTVAPKIGLAYALFDSGAPISRWPTIWSAPTTRC